MTIILETPFITLFDLPTNRFRVKINKKFSNLLLKKFIEKHGSLSKFALDKGYTPQTFIKWCKTQEFPLHILIALCKGIRINPDRIQNNLLYTRSGYFKFGGNVSKPIKPKFPIILSKELVRVIAHLFGDGCLSLNNLHTAYYNQSKKLRDQFKKDITKTFGYSNFKESINKTTPYISIPVPISLILLTIVDNFNSNKIRIPYFIMSSSKKIQKEFIKAFFDDEAYVRFTPPHRYIELSLCNNLFIEDIKDILNEFDIKTTKTYYKNSRGFGIYYFYIKNFHNLKKFSDEIGFYHPAKKEKLRKILKLPGRKSYSHGETKQKILTLLNKGLKTSTELSNVLNRKRCTINLFLGKLENKGKIKKDDFKREGIFWSVKHG